MTSKIRNAKQLNGKQKNKKREGTISHKEAEDA